MPGRWNLSLAALVLACAGLIGCGSNPFSDNDPFLAKSASHPVGGAGSAAPVSAAAPPPIAMAMAKSASPGMRMPGMVASPQYPAGHERFPEVRGNDWQVAAEQPVSTFSLDVDTASYAYVRRSLRSGRLPPPEAVRVEEMVNYFPYAYAGPKDAATPFHPSVTVLPSPWNADARLVHIGIKGWDIPRDHRPPAHLTFLIDVSGSMQPDDRLPLIKAALRQLGDGLRPEDSVAIVSYANDTRVVLEPTPGSETVKIMAAFDSLQAAGGTAGGAGIQTAYRLAEQMFDAKAVNRIVLATDGDFNVGETDPRRLTRMVADKRKTGIYLTILGVGIGNLNDSLMQGLAQAGNGQAAHIDTLQEARKVWIEDLGSTMFPIADDVKIQVEFNPAAVAEYRLIGYETRLLNRSDFTNDKVDAGEIGSGHTVTAIYEYIPAGGPGRNIAPLRYKADAPSAKASTAKAGSGEIAFLKIRSKAPGAKASTMMQRPIGVADMVTTIDQAPQDVRFGVAVAGFAQVLRKDSNVGWSPAKAAELAEGARGDDPHGWRTEFVQLVRLADGLMR